MKKNISIKKIKYGTEEYEKSIDLRNEYFRKPQGLDIRNEDLSGDKEARMFGAYDQDRLIGSVFYIEKDKDTAQVKAVIVDRSYQGQGLGLELMKFIEGKIKEAGYKKIYLTGRVSVENFYHKLGYKTISDVYDYFGIAHIEMEKPINKEENETYNK